MFLFFCFDSFIYNPLHAARMAMAAAVPLPLTEQRRAFLNNLFLPEPAHAVIVRCPGTPSPHDPPYKRKRKQTSSPPKKERKGKKGENRVHHPLLLHLHGSLSYPSLFRHADLHLAHLLSPGGRGPDLGFLGRLSCPLLPTFWGWRTPPPGLPPGLPLGSTGISLCPMRPSTVGTLGRPMRE